MLTIYYTHVCSVLEALFQAKLVTLEGQCQRLALAELIGLGSQDAVLENELTQHIPLVWTILLDDGLHCGRCGKLFAWLENIRQISIVTLLESIEGRAYIKRPFLAKLAVEEGNGEL